MNIQLLFQYTWETSIMQYIYSAVFCLLQTQLRFNLTVFAKLISLRVSAIAILWCHHCGKYSISNQPTTVIKPLFKALNNVKCIWAKQVIL